MSMPDQALPFEAATGFLLARLGSMAGRSWHSMLQAHELSPHEHGVLLTLRAAGRLGQQTLSDRIAVDPRNVVPIVDGLESKNLVKRTVDPADRRRRLIDLTAKGHAVADRLAASAADIERDFLAGLTPTEQTKLNQLLQKLHASLTEHATL